MTNRFATIAVLGREGDLQIASALAVLLEQLRMARATALVDVALAPLLNKNAEVQVADHQRIASEADLGIVMGGDGTLLKAVHLFNQRPVPLVGINLGHLGFLTDISLESLSVDIAAILRGDYQTERRLMLAAEVTHGTHTTGCGPALNDVVIQKTEGGRLIEFETHVDGQFVCAHRADGIIVATPTGSTAYALSGGGSILHPSLDAMILVPICPHALGDRPIVIGGGNRVEIVVSQTHGGRAQLTSDGQHTHLLNAGDRVGIWRATEGVTFIHPHGHDYYHILRTKLHWGPAAARNPNT